MSSHLNTHQEGLAKQINAIESAGGIIGLLKASRIKFDFQKVTDNKGFEICRLVTTLHLSELDAEAHAFAVDSLKGANSVILERPGHQGGRMSHALFIKELSDNYRENPDLQKQARNFAIKKFHEPLTQQLAVLKDELANPGFPGSNPFKSNSNSDNTKNIFSRIVNRIRGPVEEESTMSI